MHREVAFGRGRAKFIREETKPAVFGRRESDTRVHISLMRFRLGSLSSELQFVFSDQLRVGSAPRIVLVDEGEVRLEVGERGVVTIDDHTGHYVFCEDFGGERFVVTTPSEERIMTVLVAYLSGGGSFIPASSGLAVAGLVGETLDEIERHMILHTLRHFHGNRTRAAEALGISLRTIRNKLRRYCAPRI